MRLDYIDLIDVPLNAAERAIKRVRRAVQLAAAFVPVALEIAASIRAERYAVRRLAELNKGGSHGRR